MEEITAMIACDMKGKISTTFSLAWVLRNIVGDKLDVFVQQMSIFI